MTTRVLLRVLCERTAGLIRAPLEWRSIDGFGRKAPLKAPPWRAADAAVCSLFEQDVSNAAPNKSGSERALQGTLLFIELSVFLRVRVSGPEHTLNQNYNKYKQL